MRRLLLLLAGVSLAGCAALHSVQLGDVEAPQGGSVKPISVKVSETTLDFREMAELAKLGGQVFKSSAAKSVGEGLETYATFFQFGPRTGTPVFAELYARYVPEMLRKDCPGGRVTNIVSMRESREYPVVKGEVVRVDADCVQ